MIMLTRLSGSVFALNSELIERIDSTPDTVITLVDGKKYVVAEGLDAGRGRRPLLPRPDHRPGQPPDLRDGGGTRLPPADPRHRRPPPRRPGTGTGRRDGPGNPDRHRLCGLGIIVLANVLEGGNPMSLLLMAPDAAGLRHHPDGDRGRRHPARRQERARLAQEGLHRRRPPRPATWSRPSSRWPSGPAARACSPWRTRWRGRGPLHAQGRQMAVDGTDPEELHEILEAEVKAKKQSTAKQAPSSSPTPAATPRPSASSAPSWAWCTCWRTWRHPEELGHLIAGAFVATLWGVHVRQRHLPAARASASSGSASSRPPGWSSSSRASPPSRPARTRGWWPRSCARCSAEREQARQTEAALSMADGASRAATRGTEEEHENHERWLVTYADMITLLMVLFIVMFAMSQVDEKKFNALKRRPGGRLRPVDLGPRPGRPPSSRTPALAAAAPIAPNRKYAETLEQVAAQQAAADAVQQHEALQTPGATTSEASGRGGPAQERGVPAAGRRSAPHGLENDVQTTIDERGLAISLVSRHVTFQANVADPHRARRARSSTRWRRCSRTCPTRCRSTATPTRSR